MKTILVVEDDQAIRDLLVEVLDDEGYRVLSAANGQLGLEQILTQQPDLVVSDLMMPIFTGVELARAVRSDARYQQMPLIAISGALQPDMATRGLFSTFLAKPFELAELVTIIARYVGDP